MSIALEKTSHIILSCKLVPVQYGEYEYGLSLGLCCDPQQHKQDIGQPDSFMSVISGMWILQMNDMDFFLTFIITKTL